MAEEKITFSIDSEVKRRAEELFSALGLDISTAVNIFIKQTILCGGLPFAFSPDGDNDFYTEEELDKFNELITKMNAHYNKTEEEVLAEGMKCLNDTLGCIDMQRFISAVKRDRFDYTEWRKDKFDDLSLDELNKAAAEYAKLHHSE